MVPQAVDLIFIVRAFTSFHTIVPYENTRCYTKLLDTFGKTGHAFVNQPPLFLARNWSYGYQIEVKQEHVIVTVLYSQAYKTLNDRLYLILFFFPLPSFWICEQKKKQIWFHRGYFCSVADMTSATHKLFVSMTQALGFLTFLFIWAFKSHLR